MGQVPEEKPEGDSMKRYTIRQLEYALAVYECGGFIRASEELGISQPTISRAVSQLEHCNNAKLFDRINNRNLTPTPLMVAAAPKIRAILADIDAIFSDEPAPEQESDPMLDMWQLKKDLVTEKREQVKQLDNWLASIEKDLSEVTK